MAPSPPSSPATSHARAVIAEGRAVAVYTLDEIARFLSAYPDIAKAKLIFPGAEVTAISKSISDPLDAIRDGVSLNDPLDDMGLTEYDGPQRQSCSWIRVGLELMLTLRRRNVTNIGIWQYSLAGQWHEVPLQARSAGVPKVCRSKAEWRTLRQSQHAPRHRLPLPWRQDVDRSPSPPGKGVPLRQVQGRTIAALSGKRPTQTLAIQTWGRR